MAWDYHAPIDDMRFVLEQVLEAPRSWAQCAPFADLDVDTATAVMQEAARFAAGVLLPANAPGDRVGCVREADGSVRTPPGYREAYRRHFMLWREECLRRGVAFARVGDAGDLLAALRGEAVAAGAIEM